MAQQPPRHVRGDPLPRRIPGQRDSEWHGIQVVERAADPAKSKHLTRGCTICLRITLGLCVGGVAVGCCLLVAGGVGRHHIGHVKILMYIGILIFLVSVALLVILCSSWGTGGEPLSEKLPKCTCRYLGAKRSKKGRRAVTEGPTLQPAQLGVSREAESIVPAPLPEKPPKKAKKKKGKTCSIKNCVCRLQTDANSGITYRSHFPLNGNGADSQAVNMYEGVHIPSTAANVFNVLRLGPLQEPPPPGSCEYCHHFCQSRKFSGEKIFLYNGFPYFEVQEVQHESEPFCNDENNVDGSSKL